MDENKQNTTPDGDIVPPNDTLVPPAKPAEVPGGRKVEVDLSVLTELQEKMAEFERKDADNQAKMAGLEEMLSKSPDTTGEPKLREKKNFEPKFRTARIRKYPIKGDVGNLGYVIGWTSRGAYQGVDKSGISPVIVDYLDVVFLGHERNEEGKLQAEQVRLLDFMNIGTQVHCKILNSKIEDRKEPTGEEIDVTVFDPNHGLVSTGEKVDGYTAFSDIEYQVQIPGLPDPVWVDATYLNA